MCYWGTSKYTNYLSVVPGPKEILLQGKLGDLFKVGDYKLFTNLKFSKNKKYLQKSKKQEIS